jgi:hypothetical protein
MILELTGEVHSNWRLEANGVHSRKCQNLKQTTPAIDFTSWRFQETIISRPNKQPFLGITTLTGYGSALPNRSISCIPSADTPPKPHSLRFLSRSQSVAVERVYSGWHLQGCF